MASLFYPRVIKPKEINSDHLPYHQEIERKKPYLESIIGIIEIEKCNR